MEIKDKEGKNLKVNNRDSKFREALRGNVKSGDVVKSESGDLEVVAVFSGSNVDEFYEVQLQSEPYPVLYRRSVKQLSEQFETDPKLGGVLLRKVNSNVFVFVPFDSSKDK